MTIRKGVVLVFVLGYWWVAMGIYLFGQQTETRVADAAIVLGAAVFGDQPSPVFRERLNHAINLYHEGTVRTLIFTGGHDDDGRTPEALVAKAYAMARGVPETDVLIETESQITWQNLKNAQPLANEAGLQTILIVSDPMHMKRAVLMARDLGMDAYASPTPTTRYRSWHTQLSFVLRETVFYLWHLVVRPFV